MYNILYKNVVTSLRSDVVTSLLFEKKGDPTFHRLFSLVGTLFMLFCYIINDINICRKKRRRNWAGNFSLGGYPFFLAFWGRHYVTTSLRHYIFGVPKRGDFHGKNV